MFSQLKLQARAALMPAANSIRLMIAAVFLAVFSVYLLLLMLSVYYPAFYPLRIIYAVFISFFALPVTELALQAKLILTAKSVKSKVRIRFKYALKSCAVRLIVRLLKIRDFILFESVPIIMLVLFLFYVSSKPVSYKAAAAYLTGTAFIALMGIAFCIVSSEKYLRSMFCLAAYENISAIEAVRFSKAMVEKNRGKLLSLKLSFFPWFVLCLGVLPLLFVIPYYKQSITCYFLDNG